MLLNAAERTSGLYFSYDVNLTLRFVVYLRLLPFCSLFIFASGLSLVFYRVLVYIPLDMFLGAIVT